MFKKFILGSALVVGIGGLALGTSAISYVRTGYRSIQETIKEQIPLDVEIKRAKDMLVDLKPEITGNLKMIAKQEIEVASLQREVEAKKGALAKSKQAILRLKDDASSGVRHVSYGGKSYDMDQVRKELSDRFKNYQTQEATCDKLEKILVAREKGLEGARRKLDEMLATKRQLEVDVENLQARLVMVEVAKTSNQFSVNDSQVSTVRQAVSEISTRIDVEERMIDMPELMVGIPVADDEAPADLIDQITSYFGRDRADSAESLANNR
jgi:hypothetical protein